MRRVVITGMGAVTPLGNNVEEMWGRVQKGQSAVAHIDDEAFAGMDTQIAARVTGFAPEDYLPKKEVKQFDRVIQFGYGAAAQALEQAGLNPEKIDKDRAGVYIGSGAGGLGTIFASYDLLKERGPRRVSPFAVPVSIPNMVAGIVAMKTGFRGPSFSPASACATGNHSIGEAFLHIKHGYADVMLAGGAEAPIQPFYFAGFGKMKAMSTRNDAPEKASRPFDQDRDGFVMGEGAGVILLESYEHARERGATILGEIIGYAATTDAYHMTTPHYEGAAKAMTLAIERAGIKPNQIDYINAHGTSTPLGDASEIKAIKTVFATHADKLKVSATKSMSGHLFGAAGGLEAIITARAVAGNIYPPTINVANQDPACDLDIVANKKQRGQINYALSNGFGFGGHNAVLVFKKYADTP